MNKISGHNSHTKNRFNAWNTKVTYSSLAPAFSFDKALCICPLKPLFCHIKGFAFFRGRFEANFLMFVNSIFRKVTATIVAACQIISWLWEQSWKSCRWILWKTKDKKVSEVVTSNWPLFETSLQMALINLQRSYIFSRAWNYNLHESDINCIYEFMKLDRLVVSLF